MALELLQGTPAELLDQLKQINAGVHQLLPANSRLDPYIWEGWLQVWGAPTEVPLLSLDFKMLFGHPTKNGSISIPQHMPGIQPAPVRVGIEGPLGSTILQLLVAGDELVLDSPMDHLHIYPGVEGLSWPAPTYLTIRAWRQI